MLASLSLRHTRSTHDRSQSSGNDAASWRSLAAVVVPPGNRWTLGPREQARWQFNNCQLVAYSVGLFS